MTEYKCIACGHVKESEDTCSCTECGYKMFPTPFDRKTVLASEIQSFIKALMLSEIKDEYLSYFRMVLKKKAKTEDEKDEYEKILKSKDDGRFPDFNKIQNYICSADKTEKFVERLNSSLDQIEKHIGTPFQMEYETDFKELSVILEGYEEVIKKALPILEENAEIEKFEFAESKLDYSEVPNDELLNAAKALIVSLRDLTTKIYKFIKQNNIYGTTYQKKFSPKFKPEENTDFLAVITKTENNVRTVLAKKYQVDIFSDGTEELHEMLRMLWNAIGVIMFSPILEKIYRYDNGCFKKEFYEKLLNEINTRYSVISDTVLSSCYFETKTEEELFKLYNKMIEIDSHGIMGVSKYAIFSPGKYEEQLKNLIGLSNIKESIQKIKAYALNNKDSEALNLHMCFYGNPGTGKTEVARIIAGILHENQILPTNKVVEVDRSGLVSQYFGATAEKTRSVIASAMGGVLFVDEAYALGNNSDAGLTDYGKEAIDTLVKAMEDYRGKFCVVFAGYKNQMLDMISINPGLRSRIQFELEFPNYSRSDLKKITNLMLDKRKYTLSEAALEKMLDITDVKRREPNFANAREVRNILDGIIMCQNLRVIGSNDTELGIVDVNKYIEDARINLPVGVSSAKILTADEELDALVGLDSVKRMVKKIKAFAKKNKNEPNFNMHMCFYGNPGTGKTEVARIISSILYDAGVLAEAKLVETDSHGLIGKYVGETAPKTQAKISDAMGGVLFIDEAYGVTNSSGSSTQNYGDAAIEVLLKNMEDHRGRFCAILAGYKNEMKSMISSNPGLESRIQFTLEFPDYSREELGQIAIKFLEKKKYSIDSSALELFLDITEYYRNRDNFANARTVRNILDQVIMNQNLRTEDDENDDGTIVKSDVEDYLSDEGINLNDKSGGTHRIGFM